MISSTRPLGYLQLAALLAGERIGQDVHANEFAFESALDANAKGAASDEDQEAGILSAVSD